MQIVKINIIKSMNLLVDWIRKEKWYVYNNFTILLQQILSGRLLLVVIVGLKK